MAYNTTKQEIEVVLNLDAKKRYSYFIKKIVDVEAIWSLSDSNGWCIFSDNNKNKIFPIWSNPIYAESCIIKEWEGSSIKEIPLEDFLGKWIVGLEKDKKMLAVFPICNINENIDKGILISPKEIYKDILKELENY